METKTLTTVVCFLTILSIGACNIHEKLHYFETLKITDFSHRTKRSSDPHPSSHMTEVKVETLGKHFRLFLKPSTILSPGFKANIVRGNGESMQFNVNRERLFKGTVADDTSSEVNLNYEEDGSVIGSIQTKDDVYVIEPSWRLLPESDNHTMVAYRKSDMKFDFTDTGQHTLCGIKEGWNDPELHGKIIVDDNEHRRKKRESPYLASHTTCELMVVADYTFFKHMGGSSEAVTAIYLINQIQFINTLYRNTQFDVNGNSMIGVGFEIGEMRIHVAPSYDQKLQGRNHYNVETGYWDTKNLLEAFSFDGYFKKYCLAHLFTYRSFEGGVLGLAYIASERETAVGGICSRSYPKYPGVSMTLNTGWSSSLNSAGHRLLALQAQLVTAHEFGHNMGSEHDPETDHCAPSEYKDGKYIMYPWAVSGYDKNNQQFSPCSSEYIFKVLKVKGYDCFKEGRGDGAFCGNGRIDATEECDAGYHTKNDNDRCCDSQCNLRSGKKCSPMNYACCNDQCQPANATVVCRPELPESCLGNIKCDGVHITCPNISSYKNNTTPCIDQGTCMDGRCLNFCERYNIDYSPCICPDTDHACHRCCKPRGEAGVCETIDNTLLPDGRPCYKGICSQGVCEKKTQDMVQRLFNIIEDISIDTFVQFMRSNIVGTVMVLSLIVWIPASCVVSYIDRKNNRKEKSKRNWMSRSNRTLFVEEEASRIRRANALNVRGPKHSVIRNRELGEPTPTVRWPEDGVVGPSGNHSRPMPRPIDPATLHAAPPSRKPLPFTMDTGVAESDDYGFRRKPPSPKTPDEDYGFNSKDSEPDNEFDFRRTALRNTDRDDDYGFRSIDNDSDGGPDKETVV